MHGKRFISFFQDWKNTMRAALKEITNLLA